MKKFFDEFKTFISRGNVMDMAVGIIIGGAFTSIVTSLVEDIVNPILGAAGGMNFDKYVINLGGAAIAYGKFITAIINFLIMAFIVFSIVKAMNTAADKLKKKEEETPAEPITKTCPYCQSEISIKATRCPHCTSELEK